MGLLGQHDEGHDRAFGLAGARADLLEARNVGDRLLLVGIYNMTVGAEPLGERLAVRGIGFAGHPAGKRRGRSPE